MRLQPLFDLARMQGMLSPIPECPVRIDASRIPENFLDGFRERDCASLDCAACGYCERIAERAVSIEPSYRREVLRTYAAMDDSMAGGALWNV